MKKLHLYLFLIALSVISCEDTEKKLLNKTVDITNTIALTIPDTYAVEVKQGQDSNIGHIINDADSSILILWDIGFLAGEYADPDGPNTKTASSTNSTFNYEIRESGYLSEDKCCGFFTFPNDGPANFICLDDENYDLVFDIMKTLELK